MKKLRILNSVALLIILITTPLFITASASAATINCPNGVVIQDAPEGSTQDSVCGPVNSTSNCNPKSSILGLPTWYAYLPGKAESVEVTTLNSDGSPGTKTVIQCTPQLKCISETDANCSAQSGIDISRIWLIALAILELLLRLAGLISVFMVVFGGIKYVLSQGQPDATKGARQTIINAMIGVVISILAAVSVNFGARLLQK